MCRPSANIFRSVYQKIRCPSRSVRLEYIDSHFLYSGNTPTLSVSQKRRGQGFSPLKDRPHAGDYRHLLLMAVRRDP